MKGGSGATAGSQSLGLFEVRHLSPALVVADRCAKRAQVRLLAIENSDSGELCLKVAGSVSAVEEAAREAQAVARRMGSTAFVAVLPAPLEETMVVAHGPPTFSPLLSTNDTLVPREEPMVAMNALGLLETQGLVANLHAADVMLKSAGVSILGKEKIGGGYVTLFVEGNLAAVQAAIAAGRRSVEELGGKLILADVISNPHPELVALLPAPSAAGR